MRPLSNAIAVVGLSLLGCDTQQPAQSNDDRFVGQWLVQETEPHALYSASMFRLDADGSLAQTWDAGFYQGTHGYVRSSDSSINCSFGSKWRSRGSQVLIIDGVCNDEQGREIMLRFPENTSLNNADVSIEIVSVGGDENWLPPLWGWSFRKCASAESGPEECGATGPFYPTSSAPKS